MKNPCQPAGLALALCLAGCAGGAPPLPGDSAEAVQARLGPPSAVHRIDADTEFEYATGPFGQTTHMARFGPDGRLKTYEQVLTDEKFASIGIGVTNQQDVLRAFGRPAETSYLALPRLTVWSYRYKRAGVWDALMHVHFDRAGIVRKLESGPDPMFDEHRFFR